MSIFLMETDALSDAGENVFNSSQELLELSESIGSYAVENDTFDFASAKSKIAENINKMTIRVENIAQVLTYAADLHTTVQNSISCQASEGLDFQNSSSSPGTTTPTNNPGTTTSTEGTTPSTPVTTTPSTSVPETTPETEPTPNDTTTPGVTPGTPVVPPVNIPEQPEKDEFTNYYQKDYSDITNTSSAVTAGGASTAVAMVLTAINGKEITPPETTKWGIDNKADVPNEQGEVTYFDNIAKAYGIECESIELTKENIMKNISEGKYMIISMDEGKFGNKGNYVVITGITEDGKIKIADPNSPDNSEKVWDLSVFLEEGLKLWGFSKPVEKSN